MEMSLHNSEADSVCSILLRKDLIVSFLYLALNAPYDALVQRLKNGYCVGREELELNMAEAKFMKMR